MKKTQLAGARTHNLKSLSVDLQPGELVCISGVSGAGKSSLALDTLYAEGQRRFVESFSPYARQFLERLERPPMDALEPVAAGVAVDRRAPAKSSRSTVATLADVEAYLSALFAREASPVCAKCGEEAVPIDARTAARRAIESSPDEQALIAFPTRVRDTAHYLETREALLKDGLTRIVARGEVKDLEHTRPSDALDTAGVLHVVVDRVKLQGSSLARLCQSIEEAWSRAEGEAELHAGGQVRKVRKGLVCPRCAQQFEPPSPGLFSYQNPLGACGPCRGFGRTIGIDWGKVIPDPTLSLVKGAIKPWNGKSSEWERRMMMGYAHKHRIPGTTPWGELSEAQREAILEGEGSYDDSRKYPGVRAWFRWMEGRTYKMHVRVLLSRYRAYALCTACNGSRLSEATLRYRVSGIDLATWHELEIDDAHARLSTLKTRTGQGELARKELASRLGYLKRVGLGYLTLGRPARTLSGGEAQRVSLTAALGTSLTGAMFILDEPTVGLHPSDVPPLIDAMQELARRGNIALVIENDPDVVRAADRVLEIGPGAGKDGGNLCFDGTPEALSLRADLPTGRLLSTKQRALREPRTAQTHVRVRNAREHNLRNVDVDIPLGALCAITGPSGSGKSTLLEEILHRTLARRLGENVEAPGACDAVEGFEAIREIAFVDQSPLGRTSRGNAATYTKAWDRLRELFAEEPESIARELTPAHFSFNSGPGRCEDCGGEGAETVEMQFLADVSLTCPTCKGKRFKEEVLAVRCRGVSVAELLELTVDEALVKFGTSKDTALRRALEPLSKLGLGYLPLGQPLSTLSGGEAQRVKLARALSAKVEGTLFLLDEPSAGLHDADIAFVVKALHELVDRGASVVVVDHDLALIEQADWVIDLGPGGGKNGGQIVATGTVADLRRSGSKTGLALAAQHSGRREREERPVMREATGIEISRAREHNLRDISCEIPLYQLTVVTGPSGSGKSTLAFDVLFAEGQRRFLETLTPYARQFLPTLPRPDVERISHIPPAVALEQRTTRAGGTSTVATVTEVAHYLRLLYAKLGVPHCPRHDEPIAPLSPDALFTRVRSVKGTATLLAPVVRSRKGTYLEVFTAAARAGLAEAMADGERVQTDAPPKLAKTREHDIDLIVFEGRLDALTRAEFDTALAWGKGAVKVASGRGAELFSSERSCPTCGFAVPELDPRFFSFNTKQGRCEACEGTAIQGGPDALKEGSTAPCRVCEGTRLAPIPRHVRLEGRPYHEVVQRSVAAALRHVRSWKFSGDRQKIGGAAHLELIRRLEFLERVGLGYLSLDRAARTLSGGELQRLRLSAQLGAGLTGALYVLDEPTIGLHPRDTHLLLENLRALVQTGSTVVVVEHDTETIRAADHVLDIGPMGGHGGGRIVASGTPAEVLAHPDSPTARAFAEPALVTRPSRGEPKEWLTLEGARTNNLQNVSLKLPLGRLIGVCGVSGSGKSTLIRQVLFPALRRELGLVGETPGEYARLTGFESLRRVLAVDQSPIGRTPRSVPATFLGIWDELRRLFAATPDAQVRGFTATRFSFNTATGGRCSVCDGQGSITHEMSFLPDVVTACEACGGARFEPATLEVRWRGLTIADVLRLSATEAREVFASHPKIAAPLCCLDDLGVGYLQLGQGSHTLSGGEAQRLKLAAELTAGARHEKTLYVLDEPTTGLHLGDVSRLIAFMHRLVDRGDTLVVIEHHPSVIAAADYVFELGPEGGEAGGRIVASGTAREVAKRKTATGPVLRALFSAASGAIR